MAVGAATSAPSSFMQALATIVFRTRVSISRLATSMLIHPPNVPNERSPSDEFC